MLSIGQKVRVVIEGEVTKLTKWNDGKIRVEVTGDDGAFVLCFEDQVSKDLL